MVDKIGGIHLFALFYLYDVFISFLLKLHLLVGRDFAGPSRLFDTQEEGPVISGRHWHIVNYCQRRREGGDTTNMF